MKDIQQQIAALQNQWNLLTEKLAKIQEARIIATDPSEKFKFDQQIKEITAEQQALEKQLAALEGKQGDIDTKYAEPKIDIYHLPQPTTPLVGRTEELALVDAAFHDHNTFIMGVIAPGGIGKSALADEWLRRLQKENYGGARRVFGWSFYSQGTHDTQTSSGLFFVNALPFFGHADPQTLPDDVAKARRLAELLRQQPSILILDGVEPLQHRADLFGGNFKDPGLQSLLRDVSKHGLPAHSLLIVSSRQPLVELAGCKGRGYQELDLQTLTVADGTALLKALGVEGLPDELTAAVKAYSGHALALVLLGNLLVELYGGDVNQYRHLPLWEDEQQGQHAERVLRSYEKECWPPDAPERLFLQLLGLFDRPMGEPELQALLAQAELAQPLKKLSDLQWQRLFAHLRKMGLLLEEKRPTPYPSQEGISSTLHPSQEGISRIPLLGGVGVGNPSITSAKPRIPLLGGVGVGKSSTTYDTHPLIRVYFGEQVRQEAPAAWQQAHCVLFAHFQAAPEKKQPDTLEELEPLYRAVHHGCLAGEYQKAREDVFRDRIRRGNEAYSVKKLGAFAADLAALADFFPQGWTQPVSSGLSEAVQGFLLADASFCLMSLGRLAEAVAPRRADMLISEKLEDWKNVAIAAENLVDLLLPLGQLAEAQDAAQQAIAWAGRTKDKFQQMVSQRILPTTLHRLGALAESRAAFEAAERLQAERQPAYPRLYSLQGAQYCALLLDCANDAPERKAMLDRGQEFFKWRLESDSLLDIAFDHLTIARALAALDRPKESRPEFEAAVAGMRKAGSIMNMPEVLLARAAFHRRQGELADAQHDLDEAEEIIMRCGMRLYAADALLLRGHLALDTFIATHVETPCMASLQYYRQAAALIADMGYGLRIAELSLLAARVAFYQDLSGLENLTGLSVPEHLAAAHARIAALGQWGLLPHWEQVRAEIEPS